MTKNYKQKYKTTNWPEYNKALTNRGNLTIWFDSKMQWQAPLKGKRGKPQVFSDAAIQFCLNDEITLSASSKANNRACTKYYTVISSGMGYA